jgi:hypothetical protein
MSEIINRCQPQFSSASTLNEMIYYYRWLADLSLFIVNICSIFTISEHSIPLQHFLHSLHLAVNRTRIFTIYFRGTHAFNVMKADNRANYELEDTRQLTL